MDIKEFIAAHLADDTDKLLLNAVKYPDIDIPFAVGQILIRRQIKEKLPAWSANPGLLFPSKITVEQCSSETTAIYKQQLVSGRRVCDLTGGLGIDTFYLSQKAAEIIYIEQNADYCRMAEKNFKILGASNIRVVNGDARVAAGQLETDIFYIDPARRADTDKRVYALADCEPDVLQLKSLLLERAQQTIIKISPMADIAETIRLLPETTEIHILSVRNECKELLFVLDRNQNNITPLIHAVNYPPAGALQGFVFTLPEEKEALQRIAATVKRYLYEPNSSLLKGGAFKLIANRYHIDKLHQHSHLYTSDKLCPEFPGRIFIVEDIYPFSGKLLKQISQHIPKAHITTRNFNLTVDELRKRSHISEGSDIYLFATTISNNKHIFIRCRKK